MHLDDRIALAHRLVTDGWLPGRLPEAPKEPAERTPSIEAARLRGMMLGLAIGDSLGNTTESMTSGARAAQFGEIRDYLPNRHAAGRAVGLPSDDTQMAAWTLESILALGELDPEDLAARFAAHRIFGIGQSVRQFLARRASEPGPWYRHGAESAGNGALMRIAPVLFLHARADFRGLDEDAALAALVTHRDTASIASCIAFLRLLREAAMLDGPPPSRWWFERFMASLRPIALETPYRPRGGVFDQLDLPFPDYVEHVIEHALDADWPTLHACNSWYSGAYLLETVPSALYILMRHGHDAEEAIVRAVNDTKDNDTVAAIVGAAVGALHGEESLPTRWRKGLLGRTTADDDGRLPLLLDEAVKRFTQ